MIIQCSIFYNLSDLQRQENGNLAHHVTQAIIIACSIFYNLFDLQRPENGNITQHVTQAIVIESSIFYDLSDLQLQAPENGRIAHRRKPCEW